MDTGDTANRRWRRYVVRDSANSGEACWIAEAIIAWKFGHSDAVESVALPGNRAAKNFFERFGLVARAIVVQRGLAE